MRLSWRGAENGTLLTHAEQAGFDVIVTLDDMRSEQNMVGRKISILILKPIKQGKVALKAMSGQVLLALAKIHPGEIVVVAQSEIK